MLDNINYLSNGNMLLAGYILILVLVFGMVIGSFLNVVGLRLLSGESIVFPPSKCPKCGTRLKWYDNIPVLAYILLLGKCRYCKAPISLQYPVVEAITGIVFLYIFLVYGLSFATLFLWILAGACIVMCITDFKEQVIFNWVSFPLIPLGLVFSFLNFTNVPVSDIALFNTGILLSGTFVSSVVGIIIAFVFFEGLSLISRLIIQHRAFGEGDTIIAMAFGAWFGWKVVIMTIILGVIVQAVFTLPIMLIKLFKSKDKIAIISFSMLILSAIIPLVLSRFEFFYSEIGSLLLVVLTFGLAIIGALRFLRRMRELNAYTLLPFGPALIVGGFITVFWGGFILSLFA